MKIFFEKLLRRTQEILRPKVNVCFKHTNKLIKRNLMIFCFDTSLYEAMKENWTGLCVCEADWDNMSHNPHFIVTTEMVLNLKLSTVELR